MQGDAMQGDTNQFLDSLLSEIDDEEAELMSDEFPTDFCKL